MLRFQRSEPAHVRAGRASGLVCLAAIAVSGCSADVSRFDSPLFGLTESGNQPVPAQPVRSTPITDDRGYGQPGPAPWTPPGPRSDQTSGYGSGSGSGSVTVAALPPIEQSPSPYAAAPQRSAPVAVQTVPAIQRPVPSPLSSRPAPMEARPIETGETIEVQTGDTLYGLSRKHRVPVSEIMSANGLSSPNLKPGQKLKLPVPTQATEPTRTPVKLPLRKVPAEPAATSSSALPTNWQGSYPVKAGDNLYGIARQHGTTVPELQRVNGITDVRKVKPGVTLKVPGTGGGSAEVAAAPARSPAADARPIVDTPPLQRDPASPSARPTVINGPPVAAVEPPGTLSDAPKLGAPVDAPAAQAAPVATAQPDKLRWPVRGKVITAFGQKVNGQANDGINISVPAGTDVLAAEAGVVAYAGSELKGYGNLVLVRHDNGWVTAYAHNDTILVQRGDRVKRGQPVGKAGKSGSVDSPQVHFELRQGSKPIDPAPYMEKG